MTRTEALLQTLREAADRVNADATCQASYEAWRAARRACYAAGIAHADIERVEQASDAAGPDVAVRVEWHHGHADIVGAYLTEDGLIDTARLAGDMRLPLLVRSVTLELTDEPWCMIVRDYDSMESLGVAYVGHGAGA